MLPSGKSRLFYEYYSKRALDDELFYFKENQNFTFSIIVARFSITRTLLYNTMLDLLVPKVVVTTNQG
jgi:hypothetical protein